MKRRIYLIGAFVALIIALGYGHFLNVDEAAVLNGAWNIYNGRDLYVDFFESVGPLSFYSIALAFKLLGPTYLAAAIFCLGLIGASAAAIYGCIRYFSKSIVTAAVGAGLWVVMICLFYPLVNYNPMSSCLATIVVWLLLRFEESQKKNYFFFAGVFSALVIYTLQTKGIALVAVCAAYILYRVHRSDFDPSPAFYFFLGWLGSVIIATLRWGLYPWVNMLVLSRGYLEVSYGVSRYAAIDFAALAVGVFLTACAYLVLRLCHRREPYLYFLVWVQAAIFASILNHPDIARVAIASFPLIVIFSVAVPEALPARPPKKYSSVVQPILLVPFIIIAGLQFRFNIIVTQQNDQLIRELTRTVGTEEIFSYPYTPAFYLELHKYNPYQNSFLIEGYNPPQHFTDNLAILEEQQPRYALINYGVAKKFHITENTPLDQYLRGGYVKKSDVYYIQVWERKD